MEKEKTLGSRRLSALLLIAVFIGVHVVFFADFLQLGHSIREACAKTIGLACMIALITALMKA